MGKKYKKTEILDSIDKKIKQCKEYQCKDPDKSAKKRVDDLAKDGSGLDKFFVNVTLKSPEISKTEKLSERVKHKKFKSHLITSDEFKKLFVTGCIISVTLIKVDGKYNINNRQIIVHQYSDYDSIVSALMSRYFSEDCILLPLKPKSLSKTANSNYIEDDLNTAIEVNKSTIVYAMARFNISKISDLLKHEFDDKKYDVNSFKLNNMNEVSYVDMTRRTAFEQNVNQFFDGITLNIVTGFNQKSNLPNFDLKRLFAVYDMCTYVNLKMNEIKISDNALANEKYKFYSETKDEIFKDEFQARYDQYLKRGGTSDWSDWNAAQSQYLTFKSVASYDDNFRFLALSDYTFWKSIIAYEEASNLYSNSDFAAIKSSWKEKVTSDKFISKTPADVIFEKIDSKEIPPNYINDPDISAYYIIIKSDTLAFIYNNMVDPPTFIVKPYRRSNYKI